MAGALPCWGDMDELLALPPSLPRDLAFAVVDLETTGMSPTAGWTKAGAFRAASEITEIGVVRMQGLVIQERFQRLCAIEGQVSGIITRITGITGAMLADAPSFERVVLEVAPVLEGAVWVAHHAAFDGAFLKATLPQGLWSRHRILCTKKLAQALVPECRGYSLQKLTEHFGIVNQRAHRALQDAEATAELLQHLLTRAEARGLDAEAFMALGELAWKGL